MCWQEILILLFSFFKLGISNLAISALENVVCKNTGHLYNKLVNSYFNLEKVLFYYTWNTNTIETQK